MLLKLRDYISRIEDESPVYIMPNHILFQICKDLPVTRNQIKDCCRNNMTGIIYQYQDLIIKEIERKVNSTKVKNQHIKFDQVNTTNASKSIKFDDLAQIEKQSKS